MKQQQTITTTYTPHELAAALGLPPESAERWIANGVEHDTPDPVEIALKTITEWPISHMGNMDAHNMRCVAKEALEHLRKRAP